MTAKHPEAMALLHRLLVIANLSLLAGNGPAEPEVKDKRA